ncbi:cytidine and dCMP deaminase domain-containing 1-like [Paramuricea clavata]|uniref:Cytidine and dCMP deaminase domain-containing protein 1 n=1 Tax=Paramuricea clavata TaxID=317549 RepID=A0A7D9IWI6_PARCT|nr:cytidine and dCMP deaminase domain-containing 1-like [Paramuricea clavata]
MAKAPSVADQNVTEKDKNDPGEQSKNSTDKKNPNSKESYADSYLRVSKDNLYMTIALWMEDFVDAKAPEGYNKVGAVLVLPNDVVLAADCSRDDVHAVARLLMKHCDKAKGCKIFMSRKPCSFCAKLLVQSKVERVLFLPFEPEYYRSPEAGDQKNEVDILFTASPIAQTIFVFHIDESVLHRAQKKTPTDEENNVDKQKVKLIGKYSAFKLNSPWMKSVKEELPWKILDENITKKVCEDFQNSVDWIARVLVTPQSQSNFKPCVIPEVQPVFDPVNDKQAAEQAKHFITIARFLATRTDDPTTGVGAVIVSPEMEILGLGWNGFPLKAQYGEFGRGSDEPADKKYPYVIHAEQNAF